MNFKGESRFDAALVADAGANPASSKFARVIEGLFEAYVPNNSDLSPSSNLVGRIPRKGNPRRATMQCVATQHLTRKKEGQPHPTNLFCQSVPNPPMNVGDWATIGRAANALFNRTPTQRVGYSSRLSGANLPNGSMRVFHGAGTTDEEIAGRWTNIPDGDYLFGGSGATLRAVSLRKPAIEKEARLRPQHFFTFGGGDYSFANASEGFKGWGADEVALPRS